MTDGTAGNGKVSGMAWIVSGGEIRAKMVKKTKS